MGWAIGIICLSIGVWIGVWISGLAYEAQDWRVMKWCDSALGYRPVSNHYKPKKEDKLIATLAIDTADIEVLNETAD